MGIQPPSPPEGMDDLHSQPGIMNDSRLVDTRKRLETGFTTGLFERLTKFVPAETTPSEPTEEFRKAVISYIDECISYRDEIRPNSLRERTELPEDINRTTVGGWVWYRNGNENVEHDLPESNAKTKEGGKYLFFSPNEARILEDIILDEFQRRPFNIAKVPTITGKQEDWVLCLYQNDNRYWYDLREEYHNPPKVRFRGFKTNAATSRGEYSERFRSAKD